MASETGLDIELVERVRGDLEMLFPFGGYSVTLRRNAPLLITWDGTISPDVRRFAEEIVGLGADVSFETEIPSDG